MYDWRRMSPQERRRILGLRRDCGRPWHCPSHQNWGERNYLVSAACYEHAPVIGKNPERMAACTEELLAICRSHSPEIHAWCILPNHYHLLLHTAAIEKLLADLGRFHGRSSCRWNGEDARRGRKTWHNCVERAMRTEAHFWVTLNYVHHNPVRHGYVKHWQDWPFSSAAIYLDVVGRKKAEEVWLAYPILDYGAGWDV